MSEPSAQILGSNITKNVIYNKLWDKTLAVAETSNVSVNQLLVNRLTLSNFRCYEQQRIEVDGRPVLLTGPNGAGKTNLLEALSFLIPGRGLRRAKLRDVGRRSPEGSMLATQWGVSAELLVGDHNLEIGTGYQYADKLNNSSNGSRDKRVTKVNGTILKLSLIHI